MADEGKVVASVWYHRGLPNFDDDSSLCHLDDGKGTPINLVLADDYEALRKRCEAVEADAQDAARDGAHPDDVAVDAFGAAMKDKLAAARAKGRGGWNGEEPGMQQRLSDMLRVHVEKGDPRDVANFCMFLHQRGETILPVAAVCECPHRTRCDCLAGCKWGFANGGAE